MQNLVIVALILIYIFSSAFLESESGGRVTASDLVLVGIMCIAAVSVAGRNTLQFPIIYKAAFLMLFVFLVSAVFAVNSDRASFELLVILFSFFGGIAIINLVLQLPEIWIQHFIKGYALTVGFVSLLCLLDFFIMPGLVSSRQLGGLQGPFRNTGQAGSFFGVHSALIFAMYISRLIPRSPAYLISTVLVLLALVFTLKRASILAVVAGIIFLVVFMTLSKSTRDKKLGVYLLAGIALLGALGTILFEWGLDAVPGLRWRLEYKFSLDSLESFQTGFLAENINSTLSAFADRPFIGVGLDNVRDIYQSHEIHSTYLGILAYGGIIGSLAYSYFMLVLIHSIYSESKYKISNAWAAFLYYLLPLLIGQMIGWGYTIHIRKREFWILMFLVAIAITLSRRQRLKHVFETQ